ncbi:MAG: hypothetical protein II633_06200 [Bacteroidales bacterium]|jgi:hypothetical protein|nr:hypothetical protein [Bacteroidales bacterium]MBQ3983346.1 hypothetical protein [Bacteroidales bacterium]
MVLVSACHYTSDEAVQLHRFERVLFDTPMEQLQGKLQSVSGEYSTELLNIQPNNPDFMQMLSGFVQDPTMREVYRLVDSVFGDMQEESEELGKALKRAQELSPTLRYDKVYTFVSGMFDYDMRVGCNSHELVISLDQYILPYTEKFNYFNSPLFLVQQSRRQYLVTDCMEAIGRQHIAIPQDKEMSLLDYMVAEGKAIYFAEQTLPGTPDSILMRYSKPQMEWMQKNETNVWSYLLQKKVLYDNDYMRFHNLIDDAPKTNAFRDSSPRTPYYIGWKIVSRYVENTGVSMDELFEETDAQKILSKSNYRPK